MRSQVRPSALDHLKLARWCADNGLPDQQRLHLLMALYYAPNSHEAIKRLGLTRYHGTLMAPARVEAIQLQDKESAAAVKKWMPRLLKLREAAEAGNTTKRLAATEQLQALKDPLLIPVLERLTTESGPKVGKSVVASLSKMPGQSATDSLVRHAVFARPAEVRKAASKALRSRSMYSYVPTMMTALQFPSDVQFEQYYMNGQVVHRLALFRHGLNAEQMLLSVGGSSEDITTHPVHGTTDLKIKPDTTYVQDALLASRELQANEVKEQVNDRVTSALQIATGNDLPPDPEQWWDWWLDYNEIYRPPKQVHYQTRGSIPQPYTYHVGSSCFPAGTKVWTSTGPMAIEQIQAGECLLAQDVETGELAYKPVVGTTTRPPSPLVSISAGGETIRATRGHPFWVSGIGWQMAKELKPGELLHTPRGPLPIESVGTSEPARCYNLIVADFGTYFVTDQQVLVHDNNLRQVTTATVPGLVEP